MTDFKTCIHILRHAINCQGVCFPKETLPQVSRELEYSSLTPVHRGKYLCICFDCKDTLRLIWWFSMWKYIIWPFFFSLSLTNKGWKKLGDPLCSQVHKQVEYIHKISVLSWLSYPAKLLKMKPLIYWVLLFKRCWKMVFLLLNKNSCSPWDWMIQSCACSCRNTHCPPHSLGLSRWQEGSSSRQQINSNRESFIMGC